MTVGELIELLKDFDPDLEIKFAEGFYSVYEDIEGYENYEEFTTSENDINYVNRSKDFDIVYISEK